MGWLLPNINIYVQQFQKQEESLWSNMDFLFQK